MSAQFTRDQITTGYGLVPNGLWTLGTTHGAKVLLGWLHSHTDSFLAGLTVNRCREALGSSQVLTWLIELERLGFIEIARGDKGCRSRFHLLGAPWVALQNRSEIGSPTSPKSDHHQSDIGAPKSAHIEEQVRTPSENDQPPQPPTGGEVELSALDSLTIEHDLFWQRYPRKTGKPRSLKAFKAARRRGIFAESIMGGLDRWVLHWRDARTAEQFIPHPATWLNDERWNAQCPAPTLDAPRDRARAALNRMLAEGGQRELG